MVARLYDKEPSALKKALKTFRVLEDPVFLNKKLGNSGQMEVMMCDCAQHDSGRGSWRTQCDENSGCINRMTCIECTGDDDDDCGCSPRCQNRRFQRHQYAPIDVFDAGKKGFGVRALADIAKGTFIYEYTGEVIDEPRFMKRREQYGEEGLKHFYFMQLQRDEFIDATKAGSIARFCNHSCNPNAHIEKWIVGPKLRMGLFAKRDISKGEEISFDYKVDRYGAKPQRCLCGEPNCVGYLGGRQQTGGVALPPSVVEALSLDEDDEQSWRKLHPAMPRKPRGAAPVKSPSRSPESGESVGTPTDRLKIPSRLQGGIFGDGTLNESSALDLPAKPIEVDEASRVMMLLMQSRENWLVHKIIERIVNSTDPSVQTEVMRMHGYEILSSVLVQWKAEYDIVRLILKALLGWPRITRNKISSSKIETIVSELVDMPEIPGDAKELASHLLKEWSSLQMAYRIPRRNKDSDRRASTEPVESTADNAEQKAGHQEKPVQGMAQGSAALSSPKVKKSLPRGWSSAKASNGKTYYYNRELNQTTWDYPPDPRDSEREKRLARERELERERLRQIQEQERQERQRQASDLQRIIEQAKVVSASSKSPEAGAPTSGTPQKPREPGSHSDPASNPNEKSDRKHTSKEPSFEKKLMKNLATYVPKLVFRYEEELGHDRCKRHARDIVHSLVDKEMRRRINDPDRSSNEELLELTEEKKRKIKEFVSPYMKKVLARHRDKPSTHDESRYKRRPADSDAPRGHEKRVKI